MTEPGGPGPRDALDRIAAATPDTYTEVGYLAVNPDVEDLVRLGLFASAEDHLHQLAAIEGRAALLLETADDAIAAGDTLRRQGELALAVDAFALAAGRSAELRPVAEARMVEARNTGQAWAESGRWDSARYRMALAEARAADPRSAATLDVARRWTEDYPANAQAWRELGSCFLEQDDHQQARPALERSLGLQKTRPLTRVLLAQCDQLAGEREQALQHIAAAEELPGLIPSVMLAITAVLARLKLFDRASGYVERLEHARHTSLKDFNTVKCEILIGRGRSDEALALLAEVSQGDALVWSNVAGRVCWLLLGELQRLISENRGREAVAMFDRLPGSLADAAPSEFWREAHYQLSNALYTLRHSDRAVGLYQRFLQSEAPARPGAASRAERLRPALIATSLMPQRLDVQRAAIQSWRAFGCDVISVNCAEEIRELQPIFPEVRFVRARRDARARFGKPLIPVDLLLDALKDSRSPTLGIVNSDIVFGDPAESGLAAHELSRFAGVGLAFGNRIDVAHPADRGGSFYLGGYDWFFAGRDLLPDLRGSDLVFGAPWWDFWMPLAALLAGHDLINIRRRLAFHAAHEIGWSRAAFYDLGRSFVASLAAAARRRQPRTLAALALHDLVAELTAADQGEGLSSYVLDRLCGTLNAFIQGEMRTLDL